jgi:predicted nucleotidyltransferase
MMNPVLESLRKASPDLCRQFNLKNLGVFGSYAQNKNHAESDLDVLYDLKENKSMSFRDFIKLEETIVQLTGVKKVDLVRVQNINPFVWITVKKTVIYV